VRSATEDRTTRAIIRDEALRLLAFEGFDRVSVRQVADAAGVSPALVLYHFGSKEGLRAAVDNHVLFMVEGLLSELTARPADELYDQDPEGARSLAETMMVLQPAGSPVPAYLRRLLVSDSDASKEMFARLYQIATATLSSFVASGQAAAGEDLPVRAAFLMINDLAVLLLRDRLGEVLGFDPLS
jgi:AcrR family transcriptional regulator